MLFKFGRSVQQDPNMRDSEGAEVTDFFQGTGSEAVVPIAVARGISALAQAERPTAVESRVEEAAAYFAPAPIERGSV